MTQRDDINDSSQSISQLNRQDETIRSGLTDRQMFVMMHHYKKSYGDAVVQEAEIRQKIEVEIAFQTRLAAAFNKEGYFVEDITTLDEQKEASIRGKLENAPGRALVSWRCFRVHSKDASVPFWLTVWFFSDKSALTRGFSFISKGWSALGSDDMSEPGLPKAKELEGMSFTDATMPHCCLLLVIDERLRFETLPLPVMRDTLLGDQLAEELASKVALAFDRIRAITATRRRLHDLQTAKDIKRVVADHFNIFLPRALKEACQVAIYLCRKYTGMTLPQIAETFGRTHASVIHACKVVEDRMQLKPEFHDTVIRIVHKLGYKYEAVEG
ncbi:MAG: helix-turn-helix domain-containing protein [bacterium]